MSTKELLLSQGKVAIISEEDYEWASQYKWSIVYGDKTGKLFYAQRIVQKDNKRTVYRLHREIMKAKHGEFVDHIDGNGLNNTRENLRIVSHRENMQNQKNRGGKSKFRGVYFNKSARKWRAQIQANGKRKYLGSYDTEEAASEAFKNACNVYYQGRGR